MAKKSHAPPFWMAVHRVVGYAYAAIYVVMMIYMVPRLWEYQVELPARTVIHAVAAITIGVVLFTKIFILRFFRYFEESMPALGLVLLVCTILLGTLSLPFAIRAHGSAELLHDENRERVRGILASLDLPSGYTAEGLSSVSSLEQGREVVTRECTLCHDLRTILSEPRTGSGWLSLCRRMQNKPTLGTPLSDVDVHVATAYLIAITPNLQEDLQQRRDEEADREDVVADLEADVGAPPAEGAAVEGAAPAAEGAPAEAAAAPAADGGVPPDGGTVAPQTDAPLVIAAAEEPERRSRGRRGRRGRRSRGGQSSSGATLAATAPAAASGGSASSASSGGGGSAPAAAGSATPQLRYSPSLARELLQRACTDCHGLSDIDEHGGDDRAGWAGVVRRMIREGAELSTDEARIMVTYLAQRYPVQQ
ncbi:hypothetical protein [Sandaracinus amylolyticus]|uniref:hypothetical protein n=1 Tax=Sandaracinus amylolyticus TaxID=927083 RepID=UPI001F3CF954|nr:hypothetical protein [Sandaracinus amylolyticus]